MGTEGQYQSYRKVPRKCWIKIIILTLALLPVPLAELLFANTSCEIIQFCVYAGATVQRPKVNV